MTFLTRHHMDKPTCSQLKTILQEIKSLKRDFDFEVSNIKTSRNTTPIYELEKDIREKICLIDGPFFCLISTAEKIMGSDILGLDAIEAAFGFKFEMKDIPFIPFSKTELERAKELNQFLILRVDKTPDGQLLTMKKMNELKGGKTKDGEKVLYRNDETGKIKSDAWYGDEKFFTAESPVLGWALVSKINIPDSNSMKNYLAQTEQLAGYLETKVFKDQEMPEEYKEAINEFKQAQDGIKEINGYSWELAAEKLVQLKINQLFRHTPVEVLYDILLMKEKNGKYLLPYTYTWTNSRSSGGGLVSVGRTDSGGVRVDSNQTNVGYDIRGVSFCRRR